MLDCLIEARGPTPRPAGLLDALSEPWPLECAVAPPARPAGGRIALLPAWGRSSAGTWGPAPAPAGAAPDRGLLPRASVPS